MIYGHTRHKRTLLCHALFEDVCADVCFLMSFSFLRVCFFSPEKFNCHCVLQSVGYWTVQRGWLFCIVKETKFCAFCSINQSTNQPERSRDWSQRIESFFRDDTFSGGKWYRFPRRTSCLLFSSAWSKESFAYYPNLEHIPPFQA